MRVNTTTLKRSLIALWPALFLAAVTFAVFFTTLVIRERTFYVFQDNIDQFFAWYQKLAYAVHHGVLPIWDANVSAGHSFVGELQAGVFYPVNLVWVWLFGSSSGISVFWLELIVVLHFWLSSVGMYLAGRSIGLRKAGALVAGLVYAFGGGIAVRSVAQTAIFFGICYIPWAFFWFQRWQYSRRKLNLLWCSITLGLIILAGHIDPWYFACMIIALSIVFKASRPNFEPWLRRVVKQGGVLIAVMAVSLIVALPQIAVTAQYLPHAVRFVGDTQPIGPGQKVSAGTFLKAYSFKLQDTLSLVDPVQYPVTDGNEIYAGLVGLASIAAVIVLLRAELRKHQAWRLYKLFIIGASGVATIIMIGYWTFVPAVLRYLPLFSQVRQLARYSVIVQFCLALLVGICVEVIAVHLTKDKLSKRFRLVWLAGFGFLTLNTAYLYLASHRTAAIDKHFVYQNIVLAMAAGGCLFLRKFAPYIIVGAFVLSAITQPVWFMPKVANFKNTYAPNYYRRTPVITYLEQYYGQARVLIQNHALPVNIGDVYNIQTVGGYGATLYQPFYAFLNEPDTFKWQHMDLLNVRFLVDTQPQPGLKKVFIDNIRHITIYEQAQYVPRAYFADQLTACNDHTAGCTPIQISKYTDTDIRLRYQTPKAETLVLSEVNYPGWQAYVDNKPAAIVNYSPTSVKLFRSVAVPAGNHQVEFRYKPFGL